MHQALGEFIHALRQADVPVSTAETLDAIATLQLVGIEQRSLLKIALGQVLAKTETHKQSYGVLFEQFFSPLYDSPTQESVNDALGDVAEAESALADGDSAAVDLQSPLGQQLLSGDSAALATAIAAAGRDEGVNRIQVFTQKSRYSFRLQQRLGMEQLNRELLALQAEDSLPAQALLQRLETRKQLLIEQVRDYVEQQYLLFAEQRGQRLLDSSLQQVKLAHVDYQHYQRMGELVRKAARQLASQHARRRKNSKRGLLDVRKTLAANAAFDGVQFRTRWRATRVERPKVMAICDVSGSVSRVARFLLLFLYSLQDVLPRVRSFVFAASMGEVTERFERLTLEEALTEIMNTWANQPTHYGRALEDFAELALAQIDNKTTVIMLGDARNNNAPGSESVWEQVYRRSRRVLWLNPENRNSWNTGDSIMASYAPFCSQVDTCQSLRDLRRILGGLLKHS